MTTGASPGVAIQHATQPPVVVEIVDLEDPISVAREQVLEQIAWDVSFGEPMAGVQVSMLWPNGVRTTHDLLHRMSLERQGRSGEEHSGHN